MRIICLFCIKFLLFQGIKVHEFFIKLTYLESSYIFKMKNLNKIVVMQLNDHMGEPDIYEMVVSADDHITFHGLRMSDGKTITGTISPDGTVNEMEQIGTGIMWLVKIQ